MSRLADWMARWIWWWALWLMRRPGLKRLQRGAENLIPARHREAARRSNTRQNRFARRYGLPILRFSLNILLASILLTGCFRAALHLVDTGVLIMPSSLRERVEAEQAYR